MLLKSKYIILSLLLWVLCFSGNYIIGGIGFYPPIFIACVGYMYMFFVRKKIPAYSNFFIFIGIVYILGFTVANMVTDTPISVYLVELRYVFKAMFIPLGASFVLLYLLKKNRLTVIEIAKVIIIVALFQTTLVIFQLVSPNFREMFYTIVNLTSGWKYLAEMGHFRAVGLAGLSIYDTAVAYSLLFGLTLPLVRTGKLTQIFIWGVGFVLFLLLIFLSGRSGLTIFLMLFFSILYNVYNKKKVYPILLLLLTFSVFLLINFLEADKLDLYFAFATEFFKSSNGRMESASTNEFINDYLFMPWDVNPIIGDGIWAQPSMSKLLGYKYATDSGYILSFISMGILGLILGVIVTVKMIKAYNLLYFANEVGDVLNLFFKITIGLLIFLVVLKGPLFFSDKFMPVLIVVFTVDYYLRSKYK